MRDPYMESGEVEEPSAPAVKVSWIVHNSHDLPTYVDLTWPDGRRARYRR